MRLAIIMNLAPRKLGSFEAWIAAMCQDARDRGHEVDVFGHEPIHPGFRARLEQLDVGFRQVKTLLEQPAFESIRQLSKYDAIHLNMYGPRTKIALLAYAAYPARVMWVDHTSGKPEEQKREGAASALLRRAADALTEVRIAGIAGVSEFVTQRDRRRFSPRKVRTIYNGVDVRRFIPKDEFFDLKPPTAQDEPGEVKILAVANLIRGKGVEFLVRGLAQAKNGAMRLRVVGDGPELPALQHLSASLGIEERVEWLGLRDDVDALLRETDIFVHPAIWDEAFGLTIAEAMSAEKAVIASRVGGIPELIEHQRTGLLVTPGSAAEIAAALELLAAQPALRRQLGQNARTKATQQFSLTTCAQEHIRWVEEVVQKPAPARRSASEPPVKSNSIH